MLDQDAAHALLTITTEAGATVAFVGNRAQLPAVGRGGELDLAAQIRGRTRDMTELHRLADAEYPARTLARRDWEKPRRSLLRSRRDEPRDSARRRRGTWHITGHAQDGG